MCLSVVSVMLCTTSSAGTRYDSSKSKVARQWNSKSLGSCRMRGSVTSKPQRKSQAIESNSKRSKSFVSEEIQMILIRSLGPYPATGSINASTGLILSPHHPIVPINQVFSSAIHHASNAMQDIEYTNHRYAMQNPKVYLTHVYRTFVIEWWKPKGADVVRCLSV